MDELLTPTPELLPSPTPVPDYTEQLEVLSGQLDNLREILEVRLVDVEGILYNVEILGYDMEDVLELLQYLPQLAGYAEYIAGFGLFAIIVALCYFVYKFFRMFF